MKNGLDAGLVVVDNALPADTEFIGATFDPDTLTVWLFVQSVTFDEVQEGDHVPYHPNVMFRKQ